MRRIVLAVILALTVRLVVASFAAEAQSTASIRKIGFLSVSAAPESPKGYPYLAGFRQGLRDVGWIEGQNLKDIVKTTPIVVVIRKRRRLSASPPRRPF